MIKNQILLAIAFLAALKVQSTADTLPAIVALSQESPVLENQAWGGLSANKSVGGAPLAVGGKTFDTGLGMHANGEAEYDLEGAYETFEAKVGVDDAVKGMPGGTVVFQVFADGEKKFDSGLMRAGDAAKPVSINVHGAKMLRLVANDGGDGIAADHADWCDAKLTANPAVKREVQTTEYTVTAGDMRLLLDKKAGITGIVAGGKTWPVKGATQLDGCRMTGAAKFERSGDSVSFTRMLADKQGHRAAVTETFASNGKRGVRWKVEIKSDDAPWTCAITSRLSCADTKDTQFWTGWGSPDFSGTGNLSPELIAKVQAGKASVSSSWSDPLVPIAFPNRSWHYGNVANPLPTGNDFVELPLATLLSPNDDAGLSLVLSPEDVMLGMTLAVNSTGDIRYTRKKHRLGEGKSIVFHMDLVPHEADWRGGLRFMTERYPDFFEAPNPRAHKIAACGAYSTGEEKFDVEKFKHMAFGFNWKLSDDFPYMGMFIPPVKSPEEAWTRSGAEKSAAYVGPTTSCRRMNDYAKWMKENGFSVLSYFNVTEYGKDVNPLLESVSPEQAASPDLWKDGSAYLKTRMPNAWLRVAGKDRSLWRAIRLPDGSQGLMSNCYGAAIVDPGDPDYLDYMVEQAKRNCDLLPDTDGICIDRTDWLRFDNVHADDGVTWDDGKPARSLFRSWHSLMEKMGPMMHKHDKVIFANLMTMRLDLSKHLDGIYTEFGNSGNAFNGSALLGLRKPVVCWSYNASLSQPNPDAFMQRHLHMGCFPTAPYPHNNHCITPEPKADKLYQEYGKLLEAQRGKKWVLTPHCVETTVPGAKVNLFEVPGGYALPLTFTGNAKEAVVRVRNIPDLAKLRASALHPGEEKPIEVSTVMKDGVLELRVPLSRGCAMITLNSVRE
jgi:hypothetical protein